MGCCSGKQVVRELGFSDSELQETNLHHKHNDSTELSASSDYISSQKPQNPSSTESIPVKTTSVPFNGSNHLTNHSFCNETNQERQRSLENQNQTSQTAINSNFFAQSSPKEVNWQNLSANSQNIEVQSAKSRKLFTVANGSQLRIRFGPLQTINQEESQYGDTAKLSEASRKEFSNLNRSNFPHE